jgi:hypothetical protein
MKNKEKFKLIHGNFTSEEAKNMLYDLIASKIQFHNREAFSIQIRTNGDTSLSIKRVEELKVTQQRIEQMLDYAIENDLKLEINADIEISFFE